MPTDERRRPCPALRRTGRSRRCSAGTATPSSPLPCRSGPSQQTARLARVAWGLGRRVCPLRGLLGGHLGRGDGFPPVGRPDDGGLAVGLDVGDLDGLPVLDDAVEERDIQRAAGYVLPQGHALSRTLMR